MRRNYDLYLSLSTTLLKYYIKKSNGELKLSKEPVEELTTTTSYCREIVCNNFANELSNLSENITKNGTELQPYVFEVTPYKVIDGKDYSCKSDIILNLGSTINARKMFANSKDLEVIINLLHLYVGLTDTIMYNGEARLKQKKLIGKVTDDVNINKTSMMIHYNCCSPEFLSNPYTASLYLGIARDCISLMSDGTIDVLKDVDMNEVKDVINKGDSKRAREILMNIALPYLKSENVRGVVEEEEEEYYDDDDNYHCETEEVYYDEGIPECNILTNPTIRENYFALLDKDFTFPTLDIIKSWDIAIEYPTTGIYNMRGNEDEW